MTHSDPDEVYVITDAGGAQPLPPPSAPLDEAEDAAAETESQRRPRYWHVFGGPLTGKKGGRKNFPQFTAGPVPKSPDTEVRSTTIPGTDGETFRYQGTFTHDPSDADLQDLRPEEYK